MVGGAWGVIFPRARSFSSLIWEVGLSPTDSYHPFSKADSSQRITHHYPIDICCLSMCYKMWQLKQWNVSAPGTGRWLWPHTERGGWICPLSSAAEAVRASVPLLCCHSISHFWGLKGGEGINHDLGKYPNLHYCCQNCNIKGNFIIVRKGKKKKSPSLSVAIFSLTADGEAPGRDLTSS